MCVYFLLVNLDKLLKINLVVSLLMPITDCIVPSAIPAANKATNVYRVKQVFFIIVAMMVYNSSFIHLKNEVGPSPPFFCVAQ